VVREDSLTLYGFADDDERSLFELLQTASGVGPRLAQAVLAVHSPQAVRRAVATRDLAALTAVPGIGKKGAERLVLELRDRIGVVGDSDAAGVEAGAVAPVAPWRDQLQHALVGLGWTAREADQAVDAVAPEADDGADVPTLLRSALRMLGRA
jgi:Holliday junction DNA helicase RuvA